MAHLREPWREEHYTETAADVKMAQRFMSPSLATSMETVGQLLC